MSENKSGDRLPQPVCGAALGQSSADEHASSLSKGMSWECEGLIMMALNPDRDLCCATSSAEANFSPTIEHTLLMIFFSLKMLFCLVLHQHMAA